MSALKFLFTATFKDGSVVKQTNEDRSAIVEGKNAFYDVLQRISDVSTFAVEGENVKASVDLDTGFFTVNGASFHASDPSLISKPKDVTDHRLVYFKRHRHDFQVGLETGHEIEYHIGWQSTVDGKNVQQTIAVV